MNEGEIRQLAYLQSLVAQMNSIIASIEGMKADNIERESQGLALAWDGPCFQEASKELEELSRRMREEV